MQDLNFIYRVISFFLIQIPYFILIIVIRPFTDKENNIVEIINESLLTIFVSMLLYYNESDRWNYTIERVFIYSILSNSVLVSLIFTISFILSIVYKCHMSKSSKNNKVTNFQTPESNHTTNTENFSAVRLQLYRNNISTNKNSINISNCS